MACLMTWDVNEDAKCSNGFAGTASCAFQNPNGIAENLEANSTIIYPNPAVDQLTIETTVEGSASVKIINMLGAVLIEKQLAQGKTVVDIAALAPGMYAVSMGSTVQKFIKQ